MAFWNEKTLAEMTHEEWESLCDGCGLCCLAKLEDVDTGVVYYTDVACRLLDTQTCRCTRYHARTTLVRDCVELKPGDAAALAWMPVSCAYRTLHEGRPLPKWHPLVSGRPESVHEAQVSVRGKCISEVFAADDALEDHLVDWVES